MPVSTDRGRVDQVICASIESPLGPLVAGATAHGICLVEFTDRGSLASQIDGVRRRFRGPAARGESPFFTRLREELNAYFDGRLQKFSLPLSTGGTPFEERVWAALLGIPYGETRSYETVAGSVGVASGQRAVGRANGMNRIAILIPCHRVINKNGKLGGYAGSPWRKSALLQLERTGQLGSSLPLGEEDEANANVIPSRRLG